jgi:predicted proteasome-type protease
MTYINAFRCHGGLVMSADTEENWGDYKNYVEKLAIVEDQAYPLAIGGAGIGDLIEPMVQEVIDRATESKPKTARELGTLLKDAIDTVYKVDLPWLAVKKQDRTPEFLIGAKPTSEDFCIFRIKGRRLYRVKNMAIIGYGTPVNYAVLERMYRDDLSMQQAVMLSIYLVSLSKKLDEGVGGETSVVVVRDNGAWIDDPEYLKESEIFIGEFLKLTDRLFLDCVDISIPPETVFAERLKNYERHITLLRQSAFQFSASYIFNRMFHDPNYRGEPYPKMFPRAKTTVYGDGSVAITEETVEEIEARRVMMRDADDLIRKSRKASTELAKLIGDRKPVYAAKFKVALQPYNAANLITVQAPIPQEDWPNTKASPTPSLTDKGQQ